VSEIDMGYIGNKLRKMEDQPLETGTKAKQSQNIMF